MPAERERKRKQHATTTEEEEISANPETVEKGREIREDLDRLLEEIDAVLEENAEEFVRGYIQQGGE